MYFYPEMTGIGVYSYDFAKFLVSKGHNVKVMTSFPFYPQWKKFGGYPSRVFFKENISGIDVFRCWTYVPQSPGSLKRIMHELIYSLLSFIKMMSIINGDLLICVSPPFFSLVTTSIFCKLKRVPLHIHIQDLQPAAAIELGMIKNKRLIKILGTLERFSYNSAALISSIGKDMNENLRKKGIDDNKLLLFSNWVNLSNENIVSSDPLSFRNKYGLANKFVVLYSGNIGEKQGVQTLLDTASIAHKEDESITFLIAGDGVQKQSLQEKAKALKLRNIIFLEVQPKEDFCNMLASSDAALVMLRKEVKEIAIPSRLLNILAFGVPLIASVNMESETAKIISCLPKQVLVSPENSDELFKRIIFFKENRVWLDGLRCAEKKLALELFDRNKVLSEILRELESRYNKNNLN
jgi:colanic acid biosynthesis glycosyl transferase WcaI